MDMWVGSEPRQCPSVDTLGTQKALHTDYWIQPEQEPLRLCLMCSGAWARSTYTAATTRSNHPASQSQPHPPAGTAPGGAQSLPRLPEEPFAQCIRTFFSLPIPKWPACNPKAGTGCWPSSSRVETMPSMSVAVIFLWLVLQGLKWLERSTPDCRRLVPCYSAGLARPPPAQV